ncbi:expressed unknown protein [Ectocarpus siliculosus]|uniref:Cyclic nucleotide-binding domain-containing protein n=1 Tax=Ectocarpus siliculosus TaxID=2880 RepID=D7FWC6_ECTSI|nr:expressed unknown protein [Ectocarpus siliculosus]|eukprot:CBJ32014.1 expressed unknown protein [Ectocarpus siliculosus]
MCENDTITEGRRGTCLTELTRHKSSVCDAGLDNEVGAAAVAPDPQRGLAAKCAREDSSENTAAHKRLLAESLIVFHDKRSSSRQLATQIMVRLVGRLAVVQGADDIIAVVEKLHVPHASRSGVNAIITDLDPKIPKLMESLRLRSLRPGLGKLPIVSVIVVVDPDDLRPELLASAIESGVDAVIRRPLERSSFTSCVGEVLRKHASVEFVYKDVVGEVETFNYPRFLLEGFHFLGVGETGSVGGGVGEGDSTFNEIAGDAVRTYTKEASTGSGNGSVTTVGTGGWAQDGIVSPNGGNAGQSEAPLPTPLETPVEASTTATDATGFGSAARKSSRQAATARMMGKTKVLTTMRGGHVKITSPSLRPRLYLYTGDKGYVGGGGSTMNANTDSRDGGKRSSAGCSNGGVGGSGGINGAGGDRDRQNQGGTEVDRRVESERQAWQSKGRTAAAGTSSSLRPSVPTPGSFTTSAGHAPTAAGHGAGSGLRAQRNARIGPGFPPGVGIIPPGRALPQNRTRPPKTTGTAVGPAAEGSWRAATVRAPRPDEGNPVSQKKIFNATGTQGRRAATRAGMFDEVLRRDQTNANPTEMASTGNLRSALGVVVTGEAAARLVIGRMIQNRKARMAKTAMSNGGEDGSRGAGACAYGPISKRAPRGGLTGGRSMAAGRDRGGRGGSAGALKRKPVKGVSTSAGGVSGGLLGEGIFKTVLSSMAKKRLREGLQEIKSNPLDLLRRGFVEVEPTKHGSTALGCHLIKGWEEQTNGNKSRALGHFRRAVASEPENVEALFCKAVLSAQLMELFDALKDFSAAISFKLDETHRAALQQRGASNTKRPSNGVTASGSAGGVSTHGRDGGGAGTAKGGGASGKSNVSLAHLYGNRALVHVCLGDDDSALDDLDRAVARDTRNITYRSNRALILRRVGDFRGAQQDYSRIRALQILEQTAADRSATQETISRPATPAVKDGPHTGSIALNGSPTTAGAAGAAEATGAPEEKGGATRPWAVKSHGKGISSGGGGLVPDGSAAVHARARSLPSAGARTTTAVVAEPGVGTVEKPTAGHREHVQRCASSPLLERTSHGNVGVGAVIPTPGKSLLLEENKTPASPGHGGRSIEEHKGTAQDGGSAAAAADGPATSSTRTGTATMTTGYSLPKGRQGASLVEFKASMGLSAKGELFDDLFCRPSFLDEALTTEPGRRTPEQVVHVVEALAACPAFDGLEKEVMIEIGNAVEYRVLDKMSAAFLQGEEIDAMVVILSGRVAVKLRRADFSVVTADELGPGDTFGEACMLDEHRITAQRRRNSNCNENACEGAQGSGGADKPPGSPTSPREVNDSESPRVVVPKDKGTPEYQPEEPLTEGAGLPGRGGTGGRARVGSGSGSSPGTGRSMETYQTLEPTRLVLILKRDFYRMPGLLKHCAHAFKRRLDAIKLCGLFGGWEHEDLMRLTRMSRIHRHPSKSVLLMQRKEPSHLHIVLSGACTVTKYPDRLSAVQRKINEIGAALYRIKSKYSYHRDVRTKVVLADPIRARYAKRSLSERYAVGSEPWLSFVEKTTRSVGNLQYPQFFGEVCLLVPDGGEALGTVSADTLVETVSMSKFVLQTFHVTDTFLQGVRQKASIYPEDINLAKAIEVDKWWEVRRRELVLETLIGPAATASGGGGWKHKNQALVRKRPKRSKRPSTAN